MEARWGVPAQELPVDHPGWALEANYLALGLATWVCTLSPSRIVIGGGVMQQQHLFPMVRRELTRLLNGYIRAGALTDEIDQYGCRRSLATARACWERSHWLRLRIARWRDGRMTLNSALVKSTVVAALGGLLFGFDTAVIAGTTAALKPLLRPHIRRIGADSVDRLVGHGDWCSRGQHSG